MNIFKKMTKKNKQQTTYTKQNKTNKNYTNGQFNN